MLYHFGSSSAMGPAAEYLSFPCQAIYVCVYVCMSLFCVYFRPSVRACVRVCADEEKLFAGGQPDADWEEFAIVAADLLERIQSSMPYHNSPYASSASDNDDDDFATEQAMKISQTGFKMWLTNS